MTFELWCLVVGVLLVGVAFTTPRIDPLPMTTSILYIGAGVLLGPFVLGALHLSPTDEPLLLERLTEAVVVIAVFSSGLKLRLAIGDRRWRGPLRLAFVSMTLTVSLIALVGVVALSLSWGAAILLGAILAPTDPVLASEVELRHRKDDDGLRRDLTGEATFNDGAAFPFVMLGLGLLGLHELGPLGVRFFALDVAWPIAGALGLGGAVGFLGGRVMRAVRSRYGDDAALDDFFVLGLLVATYGLALWTETYGFLAAAALGLGLPRGERKQEDARAVETPTPVTHVALGFTDQLMRFAELGMVLLLGTMLTRDTLRWEWLWFVPLLLLVIRPLAVWIGLAGVANRTPRRALIAWFGIRGIGSLYYLAFALRHGVSGETADALTSITLMTVVASIVAHGLTVTPLLSAYERRRTREQPERG
jgi:NhaP-type Na+/H+ or K+/H+ antiporter